MKVMWLAVFLGVCLFIEAVLSIPYAVEDPEAFEEYNEKMEDLLLRPDKKSCVRRGASCDSRPNDCCYSSSCRCNLWGTNCRCQRMGLFQKWGK